MKTLKLKLYQETACYKKPFATKVAETYPLPPYSTIIGMLHKILQVKPGEYIPMNVSVQGNYESIFRNYQTLRSYKSNNTITSMPRDVHQLFNVYLILHIQAENNVIDKIYQNITNGIETFTLGRNEDVVRIDEIKILSELIRVEDIDIKENAYIPEWISKNVCGINYRINTTYKVKNDLRKWNKVNVKYVEKGNIIDSVLKDEDGDNIYFYSERMPNEI